MPVIYNATALIGVEINPDDLYEIDLHYERGCKHQLVEIGNYCPKCGAPKWFENDRPKDFYDEIEETITVNENVYKIHYAIEHVRAFVGHGIATASDDSARLIYVPNVDELKSQLEYDLGFIGLWDGRKFGLWAVLFCN